MTNKKLLESWMNQCNSLSPVVIIQFGSLFYLFTFPSPYLIKEIGKLDKHNLLNEKGTKEALLNALNLIISMFNFCSFEMSSTLLLTHCMAYIWLTHFSFLK